ncbi:hypothetical protein AHAS_Ahas09G0057000 [Arachis hypogaea]
MKVIKFNLKHVNTMNVYQFDRSRMNFMVEELATVPGSRQQNYQTLHLSCRLILAACSYARLDWKQYVHPVYCMESVFNVYGSEFRPIGHDDDWSSYDGPCIQSNPRIMRVKRGRSVSSRIRNNMDDFEHNGEKRCGLCCQVDHTRRTYTVLDGGGASSSRR